MSSGDEAAEKKVGTLILTSLVEGLGDKRWT